MLPADHLQYTHRNKQTGANTMTRDQLTAAYLDYLNNYLSAETWAEHRGLTLKEGEALLALLCSIAYAEHPDN